MSEINKSIESVRGAWIDSPYYETAEQWTHLFWKQDAIFKIYFDQIDVSNSAELACGHGRHSEQLLQKYANRVSHLYCLDVIESNVDFTRKRLSSFSNVECLLIAGRDFQPIPSDSLTSIFCYDAMVHFNPDVVQSYLADAFRVLMPGGRALFHHSNLDAPKTGVSGYAQNPHARNHMPFNLFESFVAEAGLRILEAQAIRWGQLPNLDRISLLERPTRNAFKALS